MPKDKGKSRRRVRFEVQVDPGHAVYVAGSFNEWDPKKNRLKETDGVYAASLLLPRGRHEYKFVIDESWCADPDCDEWAPNDFGSLNSVITVE